MPELTRASISSYIVTAGACKLWYPPGIVLANEWVVIIALIAILTALKDGQTSTFPKPKMSDESAV